MANTHDPAALQTLMDEVQQLVRRAFSEGYRVGTNEAIDRMARAASFGADARLPNLAGSTTLNKVGTTPRMSPPRVGLPNTARSFQYGSVIGLFRQALLAAPGAGVTKEQFVEFCRARGTEVTSNQCKDVIKRLAGGEEIERHEGLYYPGRRLRPFVESGDQDDRKANGQLPLDDGDEAGTQAGKH